MRRKSRKGGNFTAEETRNVERGKERGERFWKKSLKRCDSESATELHEKSSMLDEKREVFDQKGAGRSGGKSTDFLRGKATDGLGDHKKRAVPLATPRNGDHLNPRG